MNPNTPNQTTEIQPTDSSQATPIIVGEWIEFRDANDRLLCRYSPLRDVISIKKKELTTEIDLSQLRRRWFQSLESFLARLR